MDIYCLNIVKNVIIDNFVVWYGKWSNMYLRLNKLKGLNVSLINEICLTFIPKVKHMKFQQRTLFVIEHF